MEKRCALVHCAKVMAGAQFKTNLCCLNFEVYKLFQKHLRKEIHCVQFRRHYAVNMPAARVPSLPNQIVPEETDLSSPYQRLLHALHHDQKWQNEISLGKRVGFYRLRGDLGSGNFSQVKLAVHQLTRERVAIKILDKSKLDQKTRRLLAREIATMEAMHHPNIIRLYEVVETYSRLHLVMEYANGGELFNRITNGGRIPEQEAKPLYVQVIAAVSYMHEHNFIHRDIKAENVFYSAPGLVKLGDFGFSTQLTTGQEQQLMTFCGSPPYAAPELFRDESYLGAPVDVWALGVLLYFMVTGQMPFKAQTVTALKKHIIDGSYTVPTHVSLECKAIIEGMLQLDPLKRLSLKDIQKSEWLRGTETPAQRVADDEDNDDDLERQALARLRDLGIPKELLEEHRERGAKSAVIGTYRIVVHRLQRHDVDADVDAVPELDADVPQNALSPPKPRRKGNHSKTCVLL